MVRLFGPLVGLFFAVALLWSFGNGAYNAVTQPTPPSAEALFHKHPKEVSFSFDGPFGTFDKAQLQRGFKIYQEVCSNCHSLKQVAFRDLTQLGYKEAEVKAIGERPRLSQCSGWWPVTAAAAADSDSKGQAP